MPPTNNGYCKAIGIRYELQVKAITPKMYKDEKIKLPISIGTVPIAAENIFSMQSLQALTPIQQSLEGHSRTVEAEGLPPSYNEIVPAVAEIRNSEGKI